jgi:hypothetical protein
LEGRATIVIILGRLGYVPRTFFPTFQLEDELVQEEGRDVMYGNTYSRRRRARDVRRAAERVQRVEGAAQESQELSRG